jgi:sigma-E factor negative regulatory protein RseA
MNEERDSQLSALFDGELPGAECDLAARRLARDPVQRATWERYAVVGAALRRERGVALDLRVAERVRVAVSSETTYGTSEETAPATRKSSDGRRWLRPVAGLAVAATVAGIAVLGLRGRDASQPAVAPAGGTVIVASSEPESYVVPVVSESVSFVPPAQLANYVVAHSEVSTPLSRRNLLTALVASEVPGDEGDAAAPAEARVPAAAEAADAGSR